MIDNKPARTNYLIRLRAALPIMRASPIFFAASNDLLIYSSSFFEILKPVEGSSSKNKLNQ